MSKINEFKQRVINEMVLPVVGGTYKLKNKEELTAIFRAHKFDLYDYLDMLADKDIVIDCKNYKDNMFAGYIDGDKLFAMPLDCIGYPEKKVVVELKNKQGLFIVVDFMNRPMTFDGEQFVYVSHTNSEPLVMYPYSVAMKFIDKSIEYRKMHCISEIARDIHDLEYFLVQVEFANTPKNKDARKGTDKVLHELKHNDGITKSTAKELGITNLPQVIMRLRNSGVKIHSARSANSTRYKLAD